MDVVCPGHDCTERSPIKAEILKKWFEYDDPMDPIKNPEIMVEIRKYTFSRLAYLCGPHYFEEEQRFSTRFQ